MQAPIENHAREKYLAVRSVLGKPYCEGERYAIYNADCLSSLKKVPS